MSQFVKPELMIKSGSKRTVLSILPQTNSRQTFDQTDGETTLTGDESKQTLRKLDMLGAQDQCKINTLLNQFDHKRQSMDQLSLTLAKQRLQNSQVNNPQMDLPDQQSHFNLMDNTYVNLNELANKYDYNFMASNVQEKKQEVKEIKPKKRPNPWQYEQLDQKKSEDRQIASKHLTIFPMIIQSQSDSQSNKGFSPQPKLVNKATKIRHTKTQLKLNKDVVNSHMSIQDSSSLKPSIELNKQSIIRKPTIPSVDNEGIQKIESEIIIQDKLERMEDLIQVHEMNIISGKQRQQPSTLVQEFKSVRKSLAISSDVRPIKKASKNERDLKKEKIYFFNQKYPKDPEFQLKYAELRSRLNFLNLANFLFVTVPNRESVQIYKACIKKGNNGLLVRNLIKQRWWWGFVDSSEKESANFLWSQLRQNDFLAFIQPNAIQADERQNQIEQIQQEDTAGGIPSVVKDDVTKIYPDKFYQLKGKKNGQFKLLNETQLQKFQLGNIVHILKDPQEYKLHNHFENNFHLGNKKALYYNMKCYYQSVKKDVFEYLPLTYHVKNGIECEEYIRFKQKFQEIQSQQSSQNIWIVKPGECTNRGQGIKVCQTIQEVEAIIQIKDQQKKGNRTHIIQKYIEKPLLWQKRKFDIRCYLLITSINGMLKAFWYQEGYIRTSSKEFSTKNLQNKMVHLTNDAVQKNGDDYGKFEKGNKISFDEFSKFLEDSSPISFTKDIYPKLKQLATDQVCAVFRRLDPTRKQIGFEIFGIDFMIDEQYNVWLIECNTNPCLEICCPLLARLIPAMLENAFKLVIDPLFPPPQIYVLKKIPSYLTADQNKFDLIFDELDYVHTENNMQNMIEIIEQSSEEEADPE